MEDRRLQMLVDRTEIIDVSNRYATGVDTRNCDIYRSCFAENIIVDFSSIGLGQVMETTADAWVDTVMNFMAIYETTQHIITNHAITIEGNMATSIAYLQAQHLNADGLFTIGGYYTNRLSRSAAGWRITELKLTATWRNHS